MLSSTTDPYYVAKDEVQQAIQKVRGMHGEWKRLLHAENTATSARFQELHSEIAGELRQLEYDLQDIDETIRMVEENRARFQFDDREVGSRKEFVRSSRTIVREIQDSVGGRQAKAKIDSDKRQALGTGTGAGSAASRAAHEEKQAAISRDNQDFLDSQHQDQMQVIRRQDEDLTLLSESAKRLGETAKTINTELQDQEKMLQELDEDIDRETEKLNFVMKRMGRLLKTSDNKQLCLIIGLFVLSVVLVFLVINT